MRSANAATVKVAAPPDPPQPHPRQKVFQRIEVEGGLFVGVRLDVRAHHRAHAPAALPSPNAPREHAREDLDDPRAAERPLPGEQPCPVSAYAHSAYSPITPAPAENTAEATRSTASAGTKPTNLRQPAARARAARVP
jgi:hypothetical protein